MEFLEEDRAQSVMVGAILLFAILMIAFSIYQATVVPNQNKEVEFNDYLTGSADMLDLRNALLRVAASDRQAGVTIKSGTRYPARTIFINPPPASGRVSTSGAKLVALHNVGSASTRENFDHYLDNLARPNSPEYRTRDVRFFPDYNQLDSADVVISGGLAYRNATNPVRLSSQPIIRGNRITILALAGDFEASGQQVGVTVEPVSSYTGTVSVTNETDSPVVLQVESSLSVATWQDILSEELTSGNVTGVSQGPTPESVNISLEPGTTYELRVAKLSVREENEADDFVAPEARYMVSHVPRTTETTSEGRVELVVEVRDRFNNPVSNSPVTFDADGDKGIFEYGDTENISDSPTATVRTDEAGRARVWYNATGGDYYVGSNDVTAYMGKSVNTSLSEDKTVEYSIANSVFPPGEGGGIGGEQGGRSLVVLTDIRDTDGSATPGGNDTALLVELENIQPTSINVTGYRLDYATAISPKGELIDGIDNINYITHNPSGTRIDVAVTEAKEPYFISEGNQFTITPENPDRHDIEVGFDENLGGGEPNTKAAMIGMAFYLEDGSTVTITVHLSLGKEAGR